ncbi:aminodeoxychorismate synthase component I [Saccharospirillum mangrovi]|uniref:aminodeoxychorismate synthase component I n=1 Tax=Saccharospirillum mangrovi TaxID=2161747 RepID=UPI000D355FF1|nr:aminodeoxychorismate synthase component I [Saccharospirillum mangrovi]
MQRFELPYAPSARPWFDLLANETGAIWFHSGATRPDAHRWEWCSAWPTERYQYQTDGRIHLTSGDQTQIIREQSFIEFLNSRRRQSNDVDLPFSSGLAGHLDYDAGIASNLMQSRHQPAQNLASVDRYDWSLVLDHQQQQCWLLIHEDCPASVVAQLEKLKAVAPHEWQLSERFMPSLNWQSQMSRKDYQRRFEQLQQYILAGDIYQANLTRQWQADCPRDLEDWSLYQRLIDQVPAPYSVYHRAADHTLLSVSPERFLTIHNGQMVTQPIKGTRPRGHDAVSDQSLADELQHSDKDRAENLMIVDLLRNDLSRHAKPGSVRVPQLFELMSYSNVHHLVSTVTAELSTDSNPLQALFDAFPGGSITGAPKRRAMQIIDELELASRGSYCGSAFCYSDDGYLDSNILIRSIVRRDHQLICAAGGGIVADSDEASEYAESATKVRQLLEALGQIEPD